MSYFFSGTGFKTVFLAIGAVMILSLSSCGSSRSVSASSRNRVENKKGGSMAKVEYAVIDGTLDSSSRALLVEAKKWLGTPYKYGGQDRSGVDCSGFVLSVYRDALNIKLPRSSSQQQEYSKSISKKDLIPGDLLFFSTVRGSSGISHVGLYIGEGKMVHSSTSRGVMVSGIDEEYFIKTFAGAGRVDAYYAMLSKSTKKKKSSGKSKNVKADMPRAVEPASEPSLRYEPVAANTVQQQPAAAPTVSQTATPPAATPVLASAATGSSVSADEARRRVLNSLIEQKIDSIYASTPQ